MLESPSTSALLTDFDGTIAPIVADHSAAFPLPGATQVLTGLSERLAVVAVVSGRPASFLLDRLRDVGPLVRMVGHYGLEWVENGATFTSPEAETWRPVVASIVGQVRSVAPSGLEVEDKGISLTLHWRRAPERQVWARDFAEQTAVASGLQAQPGRMSVELRPPLRMGKGAAVERLAGQCTAVTFVGDDAADLDAFAALDAMALRGVKTITVAAADDESPDELVNAASMIVMGATGALDLLRQLASKLEDLGD
jgi:trehalose 6-phosphate phosphatase